MTNDRDLTLAEVADELGLSRDALRKRCDRGLVAGAFKADGRWFIPAVSLAGLADRPTGRDFLTVRPVSQRADMTDQAVTAAIAALVDQLAEKDRQIAQLHALLDQAPHKRVQPATVSPAPSVAGHSTDTLSETDNVSTPAAAPVETHTMETHIDPTVQASPRPWWRRLLGR